MKFVSKELAIKLKEKGFDKPCFGWYYIENIDKEVNLNESFGTYEDCLYSNNWDELHDIGDIVDRVDAPTTDQVLEWLREEKNVYISILPYFPMSTKNNIMWQWDILLVGKIIECRNTLYVDKNNNYARLLWDECCASYDDACVDAIEFVIDNLI